MSLVTAAHYGDLTGKAADLVEDLLRQKPNAAIVCAMGNTPLGLYAELVRRQDQGRVDLHRARVFQLDGYLGVANDDPRSLYAWLDRVFLSPLGIQTHQVVRLHEDCASPQVECARYEAAVAAAGGYDLAVLGLGPNGHLGFNEPPSAPDAPTRAVPLSPASLRSNRAYFPSGYPVPAMGLTAGMRILLQARQVLLLVSGDRKRAILHDVLNEPPTSWLPASYLQTHPRTWIIADRDAVGPS